MFFLLVAGALSSCRSAALDDEDDGIEVERAAVGIRSSRGFDHCLRGNHNNQPTRLAVATTPLLYADGTPTGYQLTQAQADGNKLAPGKVTIDAQERIVTKDGRKLYFHRGGYGYTDLTTRYGFVDGTALASEPAVKSPELAGDNGGACDPATSFREEYYVLPKKIPDGMYVADPIDCVKSGGHTTRHQGGGPTLASAGDAAQQVGNADPNIHYQYLFWSWYDQSGGGVVRSLLPQGARFHRCNVRAVRVRTYGPECKDGQDLSTCTPNGWVKAVYGRVYVGGAKPWLYGWTTYAHKTVGGPVEYHLCTTPGGC